MPENRYIFEYRMEPSTAYTIELPEVGPKKLKTSENLYFGQKVETLFA